MSNRFSPKLFVFALVAVLWSLAGPALASEGPRYYDPLDPLLEYDPDLFPLNRPAGTMDFFFQEASRPSPGNLEGTVFDQRWFDEYRFRWHASLEPEWTLFMEFKGARRSHVVPEDYFLKFDVTYQGWSSPLLPYGGMQVHRVDDFTGYLGLETMSFKARDILKRPDEDYAPLALKGWAELRYNQALDMPTYRLMAMVHTLPEFCQRLSLAAGFDHRFNENLKPEWYASLNTRYFVTEGLARIMVHGGYEYDIRNHIQRASLGIGLNAF